MTGKGVAFNAPPEELVPSIRASLDKAIATLPEGKQGAVVGVATDRGMNAAVVAKVNESWQVSAWVGKNWSGPVEGGARVMVSW